MQKTRQRAIVGGDEFFLSWLASTSFPLPNLDLSRPMKPAHHLFKADPAPVGVSRIFSLSGKLSGNGFWRLNHPQPRLAAHGIVWPVFSCYAMP